MNKKWKVGVEGRVHVTLRSGILLSIMAGEQGSLFDTRKYKGIIPQVPIVVPLVSHTVGQTLPAYHTYLLSAGYSKYTPNDFTSDVRKFGVFVGDKS